MFKAGKSLPDTLPPNLFPYLFKKSLTDTVKNSDQSTLFNMSMMIYRIRSNHQINSRYKYWYFQKRCRLRICHKQSHFEFFSSETEDLILADVFIHCQQIWYNIFFFSFIQRNSLWSPLKPSFDLPALTFHHKKIILEFSSLQENLLFLFK